MYCKESKTETDQKRLILKVKKTSRGSFLDLEVAIFVKVFESRDAVSLKACRGGGSSRGSYLDLEVAIFVKIF